jgi:flagellar assembly factor FliW
MTTSDRHTSEVQTRFGGFTADLRNVIRFPTGLPGFEQCREFVLLASPDLTPLRCLHAISGPAASFLVLDPLVALPDYRCELPEHDRRLLGDTAGNPLVWLSLVAVAPDGSASANLRAPIVINPTLMVGCQVLADNSPYSLHHPLAIPAGA